MDDAGFVVLLIFLPLAFFVHCILGCFESSAGRKRRVKFQHFAKLEGENHTLKVRPSARYILCRCSGSRVFSD